METIKKISELDPHDVTVVERLLGQRLDTSSEVVLILRVIAPPVTSSPADDTGIPAWCNVLEGMSDDDLADFQADLNVPVRLASSAE